jgi:outer membrane protein assembly factor BamA
MTSTDSTASDQFTTVTGLMMNLTTLSPDYRSRLFYAMKRHLFRFKNDFIGKIGDNNWNWNAGLSIQQFKPDVLDVTKFNKGKDEDDPKYLQDVPTLFEYYTGAGIISEEEADGGWITGIKGGISYDTRDQRACPMSGIWAETGIEVVPEFLGAESSFGKLYLTWRQYFTLKEDDLSFAYRLGYQQTLFGDVPFYYQGQIIVSELRGASSEGLGGSKTSGECSATGLSVTGLHTETQSCAGRWSV